jgi:hypothetical protein
MADRASLIFPPPQPVSLILRVMGTIPEHDPSASCRSFLRVVNPPEVRIDSGRQGEGRCLIGTAFGRPGRDVSSPSGLSRAWLSPAGETGMDDADRPI